MRKTQNPVCAGERGGVDAAGSQAPRGSAKPCGKSSERLTEPLKSTDSQDLILTYQVRPAALGPRKLHSSPRRGQTLLCRRFSVQSACAPHLPPRSRLVRCFSALRTSLRGGDCVPEASACCQVDDVRACVCWWEIAPNSHAAQSLCADGVLLNAQSITEQ